MITTMIKHITLLKNGDKYHDFCADDAIYFLQKAQESYEAMETNPEQWYKESRFAAEVIMKSLPILCVNQLLQSQEQENLNSEENSQDIRETDQSTSNNF